MRIYFVILFLVPSLAFAGNPWAEHYAKTGDEADVVLPAQLPAAASAIRSARSQVGITSGISYNEVERQVSAELEAEGAGENVQAKITKNKRNKNLLSHNTPLTFELTDVDYNAREMLWTATLYPHDYEKQLQPIQLSGSFDEMMEVPVLTRRFRRDEVISEADIKWRKIESSRLRHDTAMEVEQMVGFAPRRTLSPNRSIRIAELVRPYVIKKNDQVTIQFRNEIMEIKAMGEAMEDGAEGDIIRVRNKDSRQPVKVRILASGLTEAMPFGVLASAEGKF